jgi:hypothetical protein
MIPRGKADVLRRKEKSEIASNLDDARERRKHNISKCVYAAQSLVF